MMCELPCLGCVDFRHKSYTGVMLSQEGPAALGECIGWQLHANREPG